MTEDIQSQDTPPEQSPTPGAHPPGRVKHFVKELFNSNPVRLVLKRPSGDEMFIVPFEGIGDDMGSFSTSDPTIIMALRNLAKRRVMGVREVDEAELERTKKASGVNEKRRASLKQQSLLSGIRADTPQGESAAVVNRSAFPDPVDTEKFVTNPDEMKLEIPSMDSRIPKARKSKKAAETA